ncbi:MAG TPA: 3-methyl-2-oxobutanoate hydroxymethyltransferase [Clostridiales bacterium UBA8153]|nr:3-methyl-2-oxobutanoate hydroxymethyltransferase [Clostridiales bacterium UBA8153]
MKRFSVLDALEKKGRGEKLTMLTAYDHPTASMLDEAGVDIILVGDSLGMTVLGYENTLAVTMTDMIHHGRAVARGVRRALVVVDMPFMSYHGGCDRAVRNAGRLIQCTGAQAVKVEGGETVTGTVRAICDAGIPVMGHLGLTPQSVNALGGLRVQGRDRESAARLLRDAVRLEQAGIFALVLECVPHQLALLVSSRVHVPTIGIGAGAGCDGQVLVTPDLLGLFRAFKPKFAKVYAQLYDEAKTAVETYLNEVRQGAFPGPEHSFGLPDHVWAELKGELTCE